MLHFLPIMLFQYAQNCTNCAYNYAQNLPIMLKLCPLFQEGTNLYVQILKQDGSSSTIVVTPFRKSGCGHANIMESSM